VSSLRILLVDDNEAVRRGLRFLLSTRTDWVVCGEAVDGLEGVEKAKNLQPDIVLMDISMPRMNGLDATRIVRRELPQSKVILISQNDPTVARRQARDVDAATFVAKTELSRDLFPALDQLVGHLNSANATSRVAGHELKALIASTSSEKSNAVEPSAPIGAASLESILCTEELQRRLPREPDHRKENRALVCLARALADSPRTILQTLAETILEVVEADSAGLSLLTTDDGGKRFYWPAIAGQWKSYIGGGTPRDFGPCGDVLDRNTPLLFRHIERRYTYFQPVTPPVEECLLVPFYVEGKAVGTIWVIAHDERRKFDAEDERLMVSLGAFTSSAYQIVGSLDALKFQEIERDNARRATGLLAAIVDSSDDAIISKGLDGVITSWNKSAEWMFGYSAAEAIGQHITLIVPSERQDEEVAILERLRRGERLDHFETIRVRKDGTRLNISLTVSPMKDAAGRVIGASKVARDITERKRFEQALLESQERLRSLADGLESQVQVRTMELEQRNAEVLQQSRELRELSKRMLQTQDEERRRIARELHDSAGQIVTALGMNLAGIVQRGRENPLLDKALQDSQNLVHELSKEIRTVSYLLHPPLLDENGLSEAITWYVEGLRERTGLQITHNISENFGRLPAEIELAAFRVLQECLTNIHRHSESKTATIRLLRSAESVSLEIQDEGRGIPVEKLSGIQGQRSGVGIAGMRERVRHLGGGMSIQSNGSGTKISVTFPTRATTTPEPEERPARATG
jgi:PAS domain S-box-containing protein